jgi:hypothetical protein
MLRSNAVQWVAAERGGHVESFFLKANAPGEGRALWVKFTLLAPTGRPEAARAEVWAVVFDRRGGPPRAWKSSQPAADAILSRDGLGFQALGCELAPGRSRGALSGSRGAIEWDLRWSGKGDEMRLLPHPALYETRVFPRTKDLAPEPDGLFDGWVKVGDERLEIQGWRGMQGHNWGRGHAERYAWAEVSAFDGHPGTVFYGASAALKLGPIVTPLLSIGLLRHEGRTYDFRSVRRMWNRSARVEPGRYTIRAECPEARIDVAMDAAPADTAALVYEDPDGAQAICLNSKLARCRIGLEVRAGRGFEPVETLRCEDAGALEILSRDGAYGIPVLV